LTARDKALVKSLKAGPLSEDLDIIDELDAMVELDAKAEIEALYEKAGLKYFTDIMSELLATWGRKRFATTC
jgi:hypothetical protein